MQNSRIFCQWLSLLKTTQNLFVLQRPIVSIFDLRFSVFISYYGYQIEFLYHSANLKIMDGRIAIQ